MAQQLHLVPLGQFGPGVRVASRYVLLAYNLPP